MSMGENEQADSATNAPDSTGRYRKPKREAVTRVSAGAPFADDWIEYEPATLRHWMRALDIEDKDIPNAYKLASVILRDWSFTDHDGSKLPLALETLMDADREFIIAVDPLIDAAMAFLGPVRSTKESEAASS